MKKLNAQELAVYARMKETWPALFGVNDQPLAIGTSELVIAAMGEEDTRSIKRSIAFHCKQAPYLASISAKRPRMGLDGVTVEVSDIHAQQAAEKALAMAGSKNKRSKHKREKYKAKKALEMASIIQEPIAKPTPVVVIVKKRRIVSHS